MDYFLTLQDPLDILRESMEEHYRHKENLKKVGSVARGRFYVTLIDGEWFRVRVLEETDSGVRCFFIDWGDEDVVQKEELYQLDHKFAKLSAQAFVCRLVGLEELYDASSSSEYLKSLLFTYARVQVDTSVDMETGNDTFRTIGFVCNLPLLQVCLKSGKFDFVHLFQAMLAWLCWIVL